MKKQRAQGRTAKRISTVRRQRAALEAKEARMFRCYELLLKAVDDTKANIRATAATVKQEIVQIRDSCQEHVEAKMAGRLNEMTEELKRMVLVCPHCGKTRG